MDQQNEPPLPPPVGWIEALERSEADLAAGRIIPGETVMADLENCLERMELRQLARNAESA